MTHRACLTRKTAACDGDTNVILCRAVREVERLLQKHLQNGRAK